MSNPHSGSLLILSLLVLEGMVSSTSLQNSVDRTRELVVGSTNHTLEADKAGDSSHDHGGVAHKNGKAADVWSPVGVDDGEAEFDYCGYSVAMSANGTIVAVGVPGNSGGHVRVYHEADGKWSRAKIKGLAADVKFGHSVAMNADGTTIAIGKNINGDKAGNVSIYHEADGKWSQVDADIDGEAAGDNFGYSVAMSANGTTIAIGAPFNDGNGSDAGHVKVYREADGKWSPVGADIDGEAAGDNFGHSVAMSANGTIAIGAPGNSGHVRVYHEADGKWSKVGADIDGDHVLDDQPKISVDMSADGTTIAIGVPHKKKNGDKAGHVGVYHEADGKWSPVGADIDGEEEYDYFGKSVAMSANGRTIAIGAPKKKPKMAYVTSAA